MLFDVAKVHTTLPDMVVDNKIGPMLAVREVANLLHVHSNTVRRWSDRGLIRAYRITHRGDRRFNGEDIGQFLADMNANKGNPPKVGSIQR